MKQYDFKKDSIIFKQGDEGLMMYAIQSGKVGIFVNYGEKAQKMLVELPAGKYFGEMAIIDDMPRSATAVALEDSALTGVDRDSFYEFIKIQPSVAIDMMSNLSSRLRALTMDFMDACKAISESIEENQKNIKKPGLFERLKKYSDMYVEASTVLDPKTGERIYVGNSYFGDTYNGMMF